jgi:hypothetical protein
MWQNYAIMIKNLYFYKSNKKSKHARFDCFVL